ncbi:MAG: 4Fe-4S binding protein [Promethearchaeota archaeon]
MKRINKPAQIIISNYYSEINQDLCAACTTCVEHCPMDAITVDEIASINRNCCIGCGMYISICPSDAI